MKRTKRKICITLLLSCVIFLIMIAFYGVKATSNEESILNEKELKEDLSVDGSEIMKYDAKTGETTKADIGEITALLNSKWGTSILFKWNSVKYSK